MDVRRVLGASALLVACVVSPLPAQAQQADPTTITATVVRVVGGDTVDVALSDGTPERVRLLGIDTSESADGGGAQCFGQEAEARTAQLLGGQEVTISFDPTQETHDRYGRLLGYVWLPDGTLVNQQLLVEGYAHEYTYHLRYRYQTDFLAAEQWAKANDLGLWSRATCAGPVYPSDLDDVTALAVEATEAATGAATEAVGAEAVSAVAGTSLAGDAATPVMAVAAPDGASASATSVAAPDGAIVPEAPVASAGDAVAPQDLTAERDDAAPAGS